MAGLELAEVPLIDRDIYQAGTSIVRRTVTCSGDVLDQPASGGSSVVTPA